MLLPAEEGNNPTSGSEQWAAGSIEDFKAPGAGHEQNCVLDRKGDV